MTKSKRSFPQRTFVLGLLVGAVGYPYYAAVDRGPGLAVMIIGPVISAAAIVYWLRGRGSTNATLSRWDRRRQRHGGTASWRDHLQVSSAWAMRRKAAVLKPSLARKGWIRQWWVLLRTPVTEYAAKVASAGIRAIWSPNEDVTGMFGGPRTGKSGALACRIADAPGAVLATSTRVDLVELTAPLRRVGVTKRSFIFWRRVVRRPSEIHIFNPGGLGGWSSTLKWSPLVGCRNPETAQLRAADLIPSAASSEAEHWAELARGILAVLLHAAALQDLPMRAVLSWITDPSEEKQAEVDVALGNSPEARTMRLAAKQFFTTNSRTQTSITTSVMPALRWLNNSRAASIGDPGPEELVDVERLIREGATVYMLEGDTGTSAPLIAALVAEFARQARAIASTMPQNRLDPSLTLALDEAALICPVPLHKWTADMGGRGITIHYSLQSRAQLRDRWGDEAAGTILNNTATLLVYGGTRDTEDLHAWSVLSGERDVTVETHDADGKLTSTTTRREPILAEGTIANLPSGTCMVAKRGMPISLGRTQMAWKRRDINHARKANPFQVITETNYRDKGIGEDLRVGAAIPMPATSAPAPDPAEAPEPEAPTAQEIPAAPTTAEPHPAPAPRPGRRTKGRKQDAPRTAAAKPSWSPSPSWATPEQPNPETAAPTPKEPTTPPTTPPSADSAEQWFIPKPESER
ncbi:type IV secretory system conjugative DNA transfer family protein [Kribbella sp. NPDC058693]|uniref:type IV secretory system conjugative DNA transfer family protein n=1 Tax=Kribbella sp. NPDC058693 TaxID=3346602 RepID=UPI00366075E8